MVKQGLVIIGAGYVSFSEVRRKAVPGVPSCRVIRDAVYIHRTLAEAVESAVAAIDELAGLTKCLTENEPEITDPFSSPPRKRGSRAGAEISAPWIPAFAGMTGGAWAFSVRL